MSEQAEMSISIPDLWTIDPEDDLKTVTMSRQVKDEDGLSWHQLIAYISIIDGEDGNANLRLILAAPELLAALREMIESFSMGNVGVDAMALNIKAKKLARAAIDKATGGEG
jgi:hypothetical protein